MDPSPTSSISSSDLYRPSRFLPERSHVKIPHDKTLVGSSETPFHDDGMHTPDPECCGDLERDYEPFEIEENNLVPVLNHPPNPKGNGAIFETLKRKREDNSEILNANTEVANQSGVDTLSKGSPEPNGPGSLHRGPSLNAAIGNASPNNKRFKPSDTGSMVKPGVNGVSRSLFLPAELWQHIFRFVPPVFLGRLLRVNRDFHTFLTPGLANDNLLSRTASGTVKPLAANSIWMTSRRLYCPALPKPLRGVQELDMWRLLCGHACQICGLTRAPDTTIQPDNAWNPGPGEHGEINVHLASHFPVFLLPGLPFAYITRSYDYISNEVLRNSTQSDSSKVDKYFYTPHLEAIKKDFEDVKALGSACVEEWLKGLDPSRQDRIDDVERWERYEAKGGLKKLSSKPQPRTPFTIRPGALSNGACLEDMSSDRSTPQSFALPSRPDTAHVSFPPSSTATTAAFDSKVQRQSNSLQPPRPERDVRDVNEAKAARQAEIERRCAALDPPLLLPILSHMESFQAALQITQPMTNNAWEVLKPRLLAQRSYAEKKENERLKQVKVLQAEAKQRRQQEVQLKETKEALDREWDIVQAPVRERISELADEIIESGWDGGKKITKETSPRFAAEVLLYVRDRFYADIAKEDEVARAAGQPLKVDAANAPPARKLILENMKRVFDTKIKPPTENFQKELFLCNGCEGNFKFYGFDSVIQHYAAKHTNTLSLGTIVVHWKAEWPEVPPFHPDPSASKAAYYKIPTPVGTSLPGLPGREPYLPQVYGYRQAGEPAYPVPQPSPGPYQPIYNGNHHESPYHSNQAQQYRPAPGPPPAPNYTLSTGLGYPIPPTGYMNGPPGYTGYSTSLQSQNSLGHPQRPPAHGNSGFPYRQDHPVPHQAPSNLSHGYGPPMTLPQSISYPPSMDSIIPAASHSSDLYQRQMDAMAKHARDVWFGTSGIKDIPQSVRIFVVIQHMVNRFKATFTNEPSLAMFIDGLDHNSVMRPVRSLNGLGCKTCVTSAPTDLNSLPAGDRRLYTLPHLLNHFRSAHLEVLQQTMITHSEHEILELDWKRDMIELPELPLIADLINAPGIDDKKLGLIAAVFPDAFPSPLPPMGLGRNVGPVASLRNSSKAVARVPQQASLGSLVSRQQQPLERRKFDQREKAHDPYRPLSPSTTSSEPAREDEYDPHRPAYLGKIVKFRTGSPNAQTSPGSSTPGTEPGFVNRFHVDGSSDWAQSDQSANRSSITMQSSKSQDQFDLRHALTEFQRHGTSPKEVQAFRSSSYVDEKHQTYKPPKIIQLSRIESLGSVQDAKAFPLSEEGEIKNGFPSHKTRSEEMSPQAEITEADRFLDSLDADTVPVQYPHQSTLESDAEPRFTQAVEERDSLDGQHKDESKDASQWRPDSANVTSRNLEALARNSQISRSVSRNNRATPPHRLATGSRYDDRARSSSHLQIPLAESRISIRSPDRYADDVTPQESQHSRRDRETAGTDIPPRRSASYQIVPRVLEYHRRSRSPRQTSPETAYYRTRTPVEEYRPEKVIHIRSPSLRRDSRPPRVVSYDYAAESRFEYVDENGQPYRQRVEYVPVRFEERAPREPERYVIARPIQHSMPGYVQVEPGYEREHVCGDTPQTVRYPQSKQPHSGRSSASYVPEYKY